MIYIRDYKIHDLESMYNNYSRYLINYQNHIDNCYVNYLISLDSKLNYLKIINEAINKMNGIYSTYAHICEDDKYDRLMSIENIIPIEYNKTLYRDNVKEYNNLRNLINIYKMFNIKNKSPNKYIDIYHNPFNEIKNEILTKIGTKIGFLNIHCGLEILIGEQYKKLWEQDQEFNKQFNLYNNIFVPLSYTIKKCISDKHIYVLRKELDNDAILTNCASVYIRSTDDTYIIFDGYFKK